MAGAGKIDAGNIFQSTLLMRGATRVAFERRSVINFNPRSSCEERHPKYVWQRRWLDDFNPRSSCEERHFHQKEILCS